MDNEYRITTKGWEIATDIHRRFTTTDESIESIAESYGLTPEHIQVFMYLAYNGGSVVVEDDESDVS